MKYKCTDLITSFDQLTEGIFLGIRNQRFIAFPS